jgi:hypothetical protein
MQRKIRKMSIENIRFVLRDRAQGQADPPNRRATIPEARTHRPD